MKTSDITVDISTALSGAQGDMNPAPKDSTNPHFKSRYADLASCKEAAKPALAKHGLAVVQTISTNFDQKAVGVFTRLTHKSGQWYEGETWCQPRDLTPQSIGAAATYLRRYGFSAIIGLVTEEDDDGNHAQGIPSKPRPSKEEPKQTAAGVFTGSDEQLTKIVEILNKNLIPESDFEIIFARMQGKPSTYIFQIVKEYA